MDIRLERKRLHISQAYFSEIAGLPQYRLSEIELNKSNPSHEESAKISLAIAKIVSGEIKLRKKKRITRTAFDSSIVSTNPRRCYEKTENNKEYLLLLENLEKNFKNNNGKGPKAISFFAGCGGLCYGIKSAGFNIVATNELVSDYRKIYSLNFPETNFLSNDIRDITDEEIETLLKNNSEIDLFAGGPPCQGFSLAGKRNVSDPRNLLFKYYLHIADKVRPKVIMLENVRLLTSMRNPDGKLVKDAIIDMFEEIGYNGDFFLTNASDFQVPQNRERVIFIGIRKDLGKNPLFPEPVCDGKKIQKFTFGDAVSDLEYLESGESSVSDCYHYSTKHPEHVIRWLYDVPQGKSAHDNTNPSLRPPSGYNTTYKRQVWDEPACTITTNFNMISGANNVHPIATRALTIREALRIQSFPDSFKLVGKKETIRTVIGNAVPPLLAYHIAKFLKETFIS